MKTFLLLVPLTALLLFSTAHAQVSLVGAAYYSPNADGSDGSPDYPLDTYIYTTNSTNGTDGYDIGTFVLTLGGDTQDLAIQFDLADGANTFNFTTSGNVSPGDFAGIELFFAPTTGTGSGPYNPSDDGIAGNLVAVVPTTGVTVDANYPASGTLVQDYGPGFGTAVYSGATSYIAGGKLITLSALSSDTTDTGSFTLNVSEVPEPSTWLMLALGVAAFCALGRYVRKVA